MPGLDDSDEEENPDETSTMMSVEGADGQQYVVLEVIQIADGDGEQTVAVVSGQDEDGLTQAGIIGDQLDEDVIKAFQTTRKQLQGEKREDDTNDMSNCFGFDVS